MIATLWSLDLSDVCTHKTLKIYLEFGFLFSAFSPNRWQLLLVNKSPKGPIHAAHFLARVVP